MGEIIKSVKKIKEVMNEILTDTAHGVSSIISDDSILPAEVDNFDMNSIITHVQEDYSDDVDIEPYEKEMNEILASSKTQREKVTNLAIFLACSFPKLPYELANRSGHDGSSLLGLSWVRNHTLDCSGFVNWCFENSGLSIPEGYGITTSYEKLVGPANKESIVSDTILETTKPGDFAYINNAQRNRDHIGIVIDVKKDTKELVIAHESGSGNGMNITTISTVTGKITSDDVGSSGENRVGEDLYFEHILHMKYEGE